MKYDRQGDKKRKVEAKEKQKNEETGKEDERTRNKNRPVKRRKEKGKERRRGKGTKYGREDKKGWETREEEQWKNRHIKAENGGTNEGGGRKGTVHHLLLCILRCPARWGFPVAGSPPRD